MSSVTKVVDIIEAFKNKEIQVIFHQCNCFNTWGAGIAKQIKTHFPKAFESDQLTVKGDPKKLGQFTFSMEPENQFVINLYGQYKYGRKGKFTNEEALLKALENARSFLEKMGCGNAIIGFPDGIACGLAGGDWLQIKPMIEYVFRDSPFQVVFCKLP